MLLLLLLLLLVIMLVHEIIEMNVTKMTTVLMS